MDGVRFGRWFAAQRRARGWPSQRTLWEAVERDPLLRAAGISPDFLARLEAGDLTHPFHGRVRRRVLLLAWLLCATLRDLRTYLQAAELAPLDGEDLDHVTRLRAYLSARAASVPLLLPPRPAHLVGRDGELRALADTLDTMPAGVLSVTGMPGVGKTALAAAALHALAGDARARVRLFPDGIASFTCSGRHGAQDMLALLHDIQAVFAPHAAGDDTPATDEGALAHALDGTRAALAGKSALLLLDGVTPRLPLRPLLDALLATGDAADGVGSGRGKRVVLLTSAYAPAHPAVVWRLPLGPLAPSAALALFTWHLGRPLAGDEREPAELLCRSVGHLPLAIELAAAAVALRHVPLKLLARRVAQRPLDAALDGEGEVRARFAAELETVRQEARDRFALLALLEAEPFSLAAATALRPSAAPAEEETDAERDTAAGEEGTWERDTAHLGAADAAADLGDLVRHSLLDVAAPEAAGIASGAGAGEASRYALPPLLGAFAGERLGTIGRETVESARRRMEEYALAYVACHGSLLDLEGERAALLAGLRAAWQAERYGHALDVARGITFVAGRRGRDPAGERALLLGLRASRELRDAPMTALLLYRLGSLYFYRDAYPPARRAWDESLEIGATTGVNPRTMAPLSRLAHLAHMEGAHEEALRLTTRYLAVCETDGDPIYHAVALAAHGFDLRHLGRYDAAHADLTTALQVLAAAEPNTHPPTLRILTLETRAELARVERDAQRSAECLTEILDLNERLRDRYLVADQLWDEASFLDGLGQCVEAAALARRVVEVAGGIGAHRLAAQGMALMERCAG